MRAMISYDCGSNLVTTGSVRDVTQTEWRSTATPYGSVTATGGEIPVPSASTRFRSPAPPGNERATHTDSSGAAATALGGYGPSRSTTETAGDGRPVVSVVASVGVVLGVVVLGSAVGLGAGVDPVSVSMITFDGPCSPADTATRIPAVATTAITPAPARRRPPSGGHAPQRRPAGRGPADGGGGSSRCSNIAFDLRETNTQRGQPTRCVLLDASDRAAEQGRYGALGQVGEEAQHDYLALGDGVAQPEPFAAPGAR